MAVLLDEEGIAKAVDRLAEQILAKGESPLCIVGIRSRGDEVAERVCNRLAETDHELIMECSISRSTATTSST